MQGLATYFVWLVKSDRLIKKCHVLTFNYELNFKIYFVFVFIFQHQ